jgi:PilZ domain
MIFRNSYAATRRSQRQWWNSSVEVFTDSAQINGLGVNVSGDGMCLFAVANLHVGSQIELEFLPPGARQPVRCRAEVRHRALYLYGIEFLRPDFKSSILHAPKLP